MGLEQIGNQIFGQVKQILLVTAFTQELVSKTVDGFPLLVHDIVIFQQMFSNGEIVPLYLFLGCLDAPADQSRLNGNSLVHSESLHDVGNFFAGKDSHQVIFERKVKAGSPRISLAAGAPA